MDYSELIFIPLYVFAGIFLGGVAIPFILGYFTGYFKKYKREDFSKLDEIAYKLSGFGGKAFITYFIFGFIMLLVW